MTCRACQLEAAYQALQEAAIQAGAVALAWPMDRPDPVRHCHAGPGTRKRSAWWARWHTHETFRAAMRQET